MAVVRRRSRGTLHNNHRSILTVNNDDPLLTPAEAAAILRTTTAGLAGQRNRRTGPAYVCVGRRVLYRTSAVNDYITQPQEA